ncbi:MAG: hypothetical protein PHQ36_04220 [Anaerolineales bacterium]|nr:hypothetical protein [Anaerolineales bacterium]
MITNTTLTVYNKYVDPQTRSEVIQRSEIGAALWQSASAVSQSKSATIAADMASIAIPFAECANYKPPKEWLALEDKSGFWTLREGDEIARGIVTEALNTARQLYDEVLTIRSVARMDQGSPNTHHFLVGAK